MKEIVKELETVNAHWVKAHFLEMMQESVDRGKQFVVEHNQQPTVVILSVVEYERLLKWLNFRQFYELSRQAGLEMVQKRLNEAQLQAEIQAIKQEVYLERYGQN